MGAYLERDDGAVRAPGTKQMKKGMLPIIVVFGLAIAVALSGCTAPAAGNGGFNTEKYRIIFVTPQLDFPVWNEVKAGFFEAMAEYDFYGEYVGAENCNIEDMKREINIALYEDVDAVLTCPLTPSEFTEELLEMKEKGIPVITLLVDAEKEYMRTAYIAPDYYKLGWEQAEALHAQVGDEMKIGVIMTGLKTQNQVTQVERLKEYLEGLPESEIIAYAEDFDNPITGKKVLSEMLEAHPDINALFVTAGDTVSTYGKTIREYGWADRITLIGMDATHENVESVISGDVYGIVSQNLFKVGHLGGRYAYEAACGLPVPSTTFVEHELITQKNAEAIELLPQ